MQTQTEYRREVKTARTDGNQKSVPRSHIYKVGNINFIVTPIYPSKRGETMSAILLKLMNTDIEHKK